MVRWNLGNLGSAELDRGKLSCSIKTSGKEFIRTYNEYAGSLTAQAREIVERAIDRGSEKSQKKDAEITAFFSSVASRIQREEESAKSGRAPRGREEAKKGEEGAKVPITAVESVIAKYGYNYPKEAAEGYGVQSRDGKLTIKNVSSDHRIWDISGNFKHNGVIKNLEKEFYIKELNANEEQAYEYTLTGEKEPALKIEEFISTVDKADVLTYALVLGQDNRVYFKATLTNNESFAVKSIKYSKELAPNAASVDVRRSSVGSAKKEEGKLIWEIDTLDAGATAVLEFTQTIKVQDKADKVRSGKVNVVYLADNSISELTVEDFEAFGDNRVTLSDEQEEDNPDVFKSIFRFENMSGYLNKLKKITVQETSEKNEQKGEELIKVPDGETIVNSGSVWESNTWEVNTKGEIPVYKKEAEFILLPAVALNISSTVDIDDIELAVAIFEAKVDYSIKEIESFRTVPFTATHTLSNAGAAPFNYLSVKQELPLHYQPPKKEEITLKVDGKESKLDSSWIKITPENQERNDKHEIFIEMDNLKDNEIGMINPGSNVVVEYPLAALALAPEEQFTSNCEWRANTYPPGQPIIITEGERPILIPVVHQRIKILRGKAVLATDEKENYKVVLTIRNNSSYDLENYSVSDRVPKAFDAKNFTKEPSEHKDMKGAKEVLTWTIEKLPKGEETTIEYILVPESEKAHVKDAQFSM